MTTREWCPAPQFTGELQFKIRFAGQPNFIRATRGQVAVARLVEGIEVATEAVRQVRR